MVEREVASYSLTDDEDCEHDNYDTTYEDEELWQGVCTDCGAELEDELDDNGRVG